MIIECKKLVFVKEILSIIFNRAMSKFMNVDL